MFQITNNTSLFKGSRATRLDLPLIDNLDLFQNRHFASAPLRIRNLKRVSHKGFGKYTFTANEWAFTCCEMA